MNLNLSKNLIPSFTILHSNLNGLENISEEYHNFINNTEHDINILCINETSHKENTNFNLNINIEGYGQPFALGSKSSKGGVAIYVKNDMNANERTSRGGVAKYVKNYMNANERNDLHLIHNSFEGLWVEIMNDKNKNTVDVFIGTLIVTLNIRTIFLIVSPN